MLGDGAPHGDDDDACGSTLGRQSSLPASVIPPPCFADQKISQASTSNSSECCQSQSG